MGERRSAYTFHVRHFDKPYWRLIGILHSPVYFTRRNWGMPSRIALHVFVEIWGEMTLPTKIGHASLASRTASTRKRASRFSAITSSTPRLKSRRCSAWQDCYDQDASISLPHEKSKKDKLLYQD